MQIVLNTIGKRYNNEWIFRDVNTSFSKGDKIVILGNNGSGKSTLLQLIAGYIIPSKGTIEYSIEGKSIEVENIVSHISIASPYLELFEEFTLEECVDFQSQFKLFRNKLNTAEIIDLIGLKKSTNKAIKYFSSGMKQRLKLGLAILADSKLLLLDEPCSNLDKATIVWYNDLINRFSENRIIIVCSNHQEYEYYFCKKEIDIMQYKIESIKNT